MWADLSRARHVGRGGAVENELHPRRSVSLDETRCLTPLITFPCSYGAIVSRVICWPAIVKSHLRSAMPPGKLPIRRPVTR